MRLWALLLATVGTAWAQAPLAAGRSVEFDASYGYTYVRMKVPGTGTVGMMGPGVTLTADVLPRLGVRAEVSYARSQEVFGTGHHNDVLAYLGGPTLYVARRRRTSLYLQALVGGARLNGINFYEYGQYLSGYVNRPAWSFGAGGQRRISPSLSLRIEADYLHTTFYDPTRAFKGEWNLRGTASLVYSFGRGRRR